MPALYQATQIYNIYTDREDPPKSYKDLKEANFTFHHIMPYCYAAMIGHVVDSVIRAGLLKDESVAGRKLADGIETICSRLLADEYSGTDPNTVNIADPKQSYVHKFAWMGANLFMGPEGSWRLDDPKHDCEANKPCSFARNQWDQLMNIHDLLDNSFDLKSSGKGYVATPKMDLDWQGAGNFLTGGNGLVPMLKSLVHGYSHRPHNFVMDDWIVVDSDEPEWKRVELKVTDNEVKVGQAKQKLLQLEALKKVIYFRPVAIKGVEKEYPGMILASRNRQNDYRDAKAVRGGASAEDLALDGVKNLFATPNQRPTSAVDDWKAFWRLRKPSETVADLPKLKANFRIGGQVTPQKYQ